NNPRPAHRQKPNLALRELEPLASALLAILLALVFAGVSSQQARFLQRSAELRVKFHQSTRDTKANGARLTGDAASVREHDHIETIRHFHYLQRKPRRNTTGVGGEIFFERTAVHGNFTRTLTQKNTRHARLAAARSEILFNLLNSQNPLP